MQQIVAPLSIRAVVSAIFPFSILYSVTGIVIDLADVVTSMDLVSVGGEGADPFFPFKNPS